VRNLDGREDVIQLTNDAFFDSFNRYIINEAFESNLDYWKKPLV
jgi:hypothetical protein